MSEHEVLSREQWAIARQVFLAREKETAKLRDKQGTTEDDASHDRSSSMAMIAQVKRNVAWKQFAV